MKKLMIDFSTSYHESYFAKARFQVHLTRSLSI